MKKNLKVSFIILILITILFIFTYSYAIEKVNNAEKEKSFFEITQLEVSKNEKIEMTIYLEKINYDKFEFTLQSSTNMENVEVSNISNTQVEKNSNEITIEIDELKTNVNQITLYYQVPENIQVNNFIKFIATVTNMQVEETTVTDQSDVTNAETITEENNQTETKPEVKVESQTIEVQVKIVENEEEQNNNEQKKEENTNNKIQSNVSNKQVTQSNNQKENNAVTVTYHGSDNNYLSTLAIEGYTLNKEFSKDISTYFITVENEVNSLNITMAAEESSAIICVYGNDNLEEGANKILISVTAENGNVRNYRIYVTKNA